MRDVYLDNAATMIKLPEAIRAEEEFYREINANPLRGLYKKSVQATTGVEVCRERIKELFHASDEYVVVFTRGVTEAINLVASGLLAGDDGFGVLSENDKIVVDIESHHSNILPWNQRYKEVVLAEGLSEEGLDAAKVISLTGVSNVTGEDFSERIRKVRIAHPEVILGVDAAQMVTYGSLDLKALRADFVAFSGHKFGAPMGIGGLLIKKRLAEKLRPMNYGGEMVEEVTSEGEPVFAAVPQRLEGGTLSVGAIFGLSVAVEKYLRDGFNHEKVTLMTARVADELKKMDGVEVLAVNGAIISFKVEDVHPHDVAQILAEEGVAVRAGWLCAEPFLRYKGWGPVVRASFSMMNTDEDAEALVVAVKGVRKKMGLENV